eukprot:PhM_4_TR10310/c0_g1_i1/m.71316
MSSVEDFYVPGECSDLSDDEGASSSPPLGPNILGSSPDVNGFGPGFFSSLGSSPGGNNIGSGLYQPENASRVYPDHVPTITIPSATVHYTNHGLYVKYTLMCEPPGGKVYYRCKRHSEISRFHKKLASLCDSHSSLSTVSRWFGSSTVRKMPASTMIGATNRNKKLIEGRRAALEAYFREIFDAGKPYLAFSDVKRYVHDFLESPSPPTGQPDNGSGQLGTSPARAPSQQQLSDKSGREGGSRPTSASGSEPQCIETSSEYFPTRTPAVRTVWKAPADLASSRLYVSMPDVHVVSNVDSTVTVQIRAETSSRRVVLEHRYKEFLAYWRMILNAPGDNLPDASDSRKFLEVYRSAHPVPTVADHHTRSGFRREHLPQQAPEPPKQHPQQVDMTHTNPSLRTEDSVEDLERAGQSDPPRRRATATNSLHLVVASSSDAPPPPPPDSDDGADSAWTTLDECVCSDTAMCRQGVAHYTKYTTLSGVSIIVEAPKSTADVLATTTVVTAAAEGPAAHAANHNVCVSESSSPITCHVSYVDT